MTKGLEDFDFLEGKWRVRHRRLKERLAGCSDWAEFGGTCEARKILGGLGNTDDNVLDMPDTPYHALSLRTFDPQSGLWTIWWIDSRRPRALEPPLAGRFADDVGTFYADDTFRGTAIRVRYLWTRIETDTPRWEQAFSADGGKTWETNWIMDFARAP